MTEPFGELLKKIEDEGLIAPEPTKTVVTLSTTPEGLEGLHVKVAARDPGLAEQFSKFKVVEFDGIKIDKDGFAVREQES